MLVFAIKDGQLGCLTRISTW